MKLPGSKLVTALAFALLSSACTHVPLASAEEDAAAKTFETRQNMCGLYVYRPGSGGGSMELELLLDGHPFGMTAGGDYLFSWVTPGKHWLESRGDDTMQLAFTAKAGSLVFVRQEGEMGYWAFASKMTIVKEDEGKREVMVKDRVQNGY